MVNGSIEQIAIVGAGAWGTALAQVAASAGRKTILWGREPEVIEAINTSHQNPAFLSDIPLHPNLRATLDLKEVVAADALLLVTPAQQLRTVCKRLAPGLPAAMPLVICAKGIETRSGALMSEVVAETLPQNPVAVLSGPTFAREVANGLPTAVTLAGHDHELGVELAGALGTRSFRVYLSDDPVGVQIGGATKNVLAIACGIVEGKGLGENARAALLARGLSEIVGLIVARGGNARTCMGLSGLGDVSLSCNSATSRNMSLGIALGKGENLTEIMAARRFVTEGVHTARAVVELARRSGAEMPICAAVDAILSGKAAIDEAIEGLLTRPFVYEAGAHEAGKAFLEKGR
jgi:glycerol-3-phosphate dehydrogenase (NAD(P)+)